MGSANLGLFLRHLPPGERVGFTVALMVAVSAHFLFARRLKDIVLLPLILCGFALALIYDGLTFARVPPLTTVGALVIGAGLGFLCGALRVGGYAAVRSSDRPGGVLLAKDYAPIAVFDVVLALYYAVNVLVPLDEGIRQIAGDALLAFAMAFTLTVILSMYRSAV
ncbi:MAG: hypothetical protein JO241_03105, partial [Candidatus Eremiobacteraeota bacterium]|nr:hypothetical protein [Candidatus Eremiobacteraeota bacterium]